MNRDELHKSITEIVTDYDKVNGLGNKVVHPEYASFLTDELLALFDQQRNEVLDEVKQHLDKIIWKDTHYEGKICLASDIELAIAELKKGVSK